MKLQKIDGLRTTIWLEELIALTGFISIAELAKHFDPKSIWRSEYEVEKQSKWHSFACGRQVPSETLFKLIQSRLSRATFDLHHPVWRLLRNPMISDRTLRRLRSSMSDEWKEALRTISRANVSDLRVSPCLVSTLQLERFSYLDTLFLFDTARRQADDEKCEDRFAVYSSTIWILPALYANDWMWSHDDLERHRILLALIDGALRTKSIRATDRIGEPVDRCSLIFRQHWDAKNRIQMQPRSLSSKKSKLRFFAGILSNIDFDSIPVIDAEQTT